VRTSLYDAHSRTLAAGRKTSLPWLHTREGDGANINNDLLPLKFNITPTNNDLFSLKLDREFKGDKYSILGVTVMSDVRHPDANIWKGYLEKPKV
jgi:hypothetical protein